MDRPRQRPHGGRRLPGLDRDDGAAVHRPARGPHLHGFNGVIDYQDLFWFFGHPVVYVMFFPYLGAAAEAVAVSAHKRWFGYVAFVASMMMFAALSMSVWAHHMFVTGGVTNQYFAFTSTALVIPAGIEYFDMIATLIGGSIVLRPRCCSR